ncbi:hypothetical protein [Oenococcus oeni]|uniref:hypothetical protein n=1 Tax=Oenococcus oeni TaxID=1247 RepID=UPI0010B08296|nr:hypothetical protein [Oenococcus oeni]SYW19464.1 hypothetical protein OENI_160012 [Oenococcus oeni]
MKKAIRVNLVKVFIAAPSDAYEEVNTIKDVISNWNIENTDKDKVILYPINWLTNSVAQMSEKKNGQEIIDDTLLSQSQIFIGVFKDKYGTSVTVNGKEYDSGTKAEIEEFQDKEYQSVFFNQSENVRRDLITDSYKLCAYKAEIQSRGLSRDFKTDNIRLFLTNSVKRLKDNGYVQINVPYANVQNQIIKYDFFSDDCFTDHTILLLIYLFNTGKNLIVLNSGMIREIESWEKNNFSYSINSSLVNHPISDNLLDYCNQLEQLGLFTSDKEWTDEYGDQVYKMNIRVSAQIRTYFKAHKKEADNLFSKYKPINPFDDPYISDS